MRIEIVGRNTPVTGQLREYAERRFSKIAKQVSDLARLELELFEERNPSIANSKVAEATLYLKGTTLRAHDASREMQHALHLCYDELERQVERYRAKRWHLRDRSKRSFYL